MVRTNAVRFESTDNGGEKKKKSEPTIFTSFGVYILIEHTSDLSQNVESAELSQLIPFVFGRQHKKSTSSEEMKRLMCSPVSKFRFVVDGLTRTFELVAIVFGAILGQLESRHGANELIVSTVGYNLIICVVYSL